MAIQTKPGAVNKLAPLQMVRCEMIRQGLKTGDLAKKIGYKSDSLTNLLCGNMTSRAAQIRIEDVLGIAAWSTPEEFAARQNSQLNQMKKPRFLVSEAESGAPIKTVFDAADDNSEHVWALTISKLGFVIVAVQVRADWSNPGELEIGETIGADLSGAALGHFDSTQALPKLRHFFYCDVTRLADALSFIKSALDKRGILSRAAIAHYDVNEALWRGFYPEIKS